MTQKPRTELTKGQFAVFRALVKSDTPLSAYEILDKLKRTGKDGGIRAPQQVYRALEKLIAMGGAHRIESLSAFVSCNWVEGGDHPLAALMVCIKCGKNAEVPDRFGALSGELGKMTKQEGFSLVETVVELHGLCRECRKK
ncbi:MAG: Fur family transcriptional regulator [Rhodospirillales bacterium]